MKNTEDHRVTLDFYSQDLKQNPFPELARLLAEGPVIRTKFPLLGQAWMATSYDAVNELLRDHQRFGQNPAAAGNRRMTTILRWLPRNLQPIATNMLLRDEPDHRRCGDWSIARFKQRALRPFVRG